MPDDASGTGLKAVATKAIAKAPKTFVSVGGRGFTLGQKILSTDKDGVEWKGVVKKHTKAEVTEENADKVKMLIHVPQKGANANVQVTYRRVRDESAPASEGSGGAGEEDDEERSVSTATKATTLKGAVAPRTVLTVGGKMFTVGQRVIYTDKNRNQYMAVVKKHTEATVTEENADKVKMAILIDGDSTVTHVAYPRVREESEAPLEEGEEEDSSKDSSVVMVSPGPKKQSVTVGEEGVAEGKKLRKDEVTPPGELYDAG
jgi:hypothetical protein